MSAVGRWAEFVRVAFGISLAIASSMLLATGCGTGSDAASASRASPSTSKTDTSVKEAQAITYAQAVNLRAGDLPGLVTVGGSRSSENAPLGGLGSACHVVTAPAGSLGAVSSPTFQRRQQSTGHTTSYLPVEAVSSGVYVVRSAALASREIAEVRAAATSSAVVICLRRHLEDERANVGSEGAKVGVPAGKPLFSDVQVSVLPSPVQGVPAFGLRISADFAIKVPGTKGASRYYEDFFGFATGPAVVVLSETSSPRPFPAATERRLLSLLHSRAEAQGV
jgi:hypothetical protein